MRVLRSTGLCLLMIGLVLMLGCFGWSAEEKRLEKKIKDPDVEKRKEAAAELGKLATPRALQLLQMAEDDKDYEVKKAIRAALQEIAKRGMLR